MGNEYRNIWNLIHRYELWEPSKPRSWGFLTTYADQGLWERYISYLKNTVLAALRNESEKVKNTFDLILKRGPGRSGRTFAGRVCVNDDVLERFQAATKNDSYDGYFGSPVVAIVIESARDWCGGSNRFDDVQEDDEDALRWWQYVHVTSLSRVYNDGINTDHDWYVFYVAPPGIHDW